MGDSHDQDDQLIVSNLVDDAVVPHANAIKVILCTELLHSRGTGLYFQFKQGFDDGFSDIRGELLQRSLCSRSDLDCIHLVNLSFDAHLFDDL